MGLISKTDEAYNTLFINRDGLLSTVSKNGLISTINQTADSVTINASKINLEGYVTAKQLSAELGELDLALADSITTRTLNVTGATTTDSLNATSASVLTSFRFGGYEISLKDATFLTTGTSLTVNATGGTVTGVTLNKRTGTIYYMSWE